MSRFANRCLVLPMLLAVGCFATACSRDADTVTIYDPNTTGSFVSPDSIREPVVQHGADTLARSLAIAKARAHLAVARTLVTGIDVRPATGHLESLEADVLPAFDARLRLANTGLSDRLHTELASAVAAATGPKPAAITAIDRVTRTIDVAERAVIPQTARQDDAYQAAVLVAVLTESDMVYGLSLSGSDRVDLVEQYQLAYGMLQVTQSTYTKALRKDSLPRVEQRLRELVAQAMPGATAPIPALPAEDVSIKVASLTDAISELANMDVVPPPPTRDVVERLGLAQRDLDAARAALARGDSATALAKLRTAYSAHVVAAAPSVAVVDPTTLQKLEDLVGVQLRTAATAGNLVAFDAAMAEARAAINLASDQLEQELANLELESRQE